MTRVLVTGGHGFIGTSLVRLLSKQGFDVVAPERTQLDLSSTSAVESFVETCKPDWIFNLAGYRGDDKEEAERVNVLGTQNLLSAGKHAGVRAFVQAGTCMEYGNAPVPFTEDAEASPGGTYAASKLKATQLVLNSGMPATVLRFTNVYGANSSRDLFHTIRTALAANARVRVSDDITRDYIYVEDAAQAFIRAAEHIDRAAGEIINISSNTAVSTRDVARAVERMKHMEAGVLVSSESYETGVYQQRSNRADNTKATQLIGWAQRTSFEDGLRSSLA